MTDPVGSDASAAPTGDGLRVATLLQSPAPGGYTLLDMGGGRRLERFGALVVDRPLATAIEPPRDPAAWASGDLRYDRPSFGGQGWWSTASGDLPPASWPMRHGDLVFELRPTAAGHVGFFAEQIEPWRWLASAVARGPAAVDVLNLFAHTGAGTLVAAAAGARVTHVDGSRPAVAWARRNAALSGLADAPIRWIVDDALAFVAREGRRGRRYGGLILDPPSYGHGPKGERWTIADQLPALLDASLALLPEPAFVLLTAHAEGLEAADLEAVLVDAFARCGQRAAAARIEAAPLILQAASGARASAGVSARWQAGR